MSIKSQKAFKMKWPRFSLRTFLILFALSCFFLGYYLLRVQEQRSTVRWIIENGGEVYYDFQCNPMGGLTDQTPKPNRSFFRNYVDVDFYATVVYVKVRDAQDTELAPLASLSALKTLWISDPKVRELDAISKLTCLYELDCRGTMVSDLRPLANLIRLKSLDLDNSIFLQDIAPLENLLMLEGLSLYGCSSISNLEPIANLDLLVVLSLEKCESVTDLTPLANMKSLTWLNISETSVNDRRPLGKLQGLTIIDDP